MTDQEKARRQEQLRRQQRAGQQKNGGSAQKRQQSAKAQLQRQQAQLATRKKQQQAQMAAQQKRLREQQKQAQQAYRLQKVQEKQLRAERAAVLERQHRAEKQRRRNYYRTQRKRVWKARLRLFALMLAVLLVLSVAAFFAMLRFSHNTGEFSVTCQYGREDSGKIRYSAAQSFRGGVMYVNFSPLAELCEMIITGDETQMRYTVRDNYNETALFKFGSEYADVNGLLWQMDAPAVYEGGAVWLPYSFVEKYVLGINCTLKRHTLEMTRKYVDETVTPEKAAKDEPVQGVSFLLKGTTPLAALVDEEGAQKLGLLTDLSAYEAFMNPVNRDDFLTLVNKDNPITADQEPTDDQLVIVGNERLDGNADRYMERTAEMALEALYLDLKAAGFTDVSVTRAYQSYASVNYKYNQEKAAGRTAALPGTLESETGLSCDMHNMEDEDVAFGETEAGKWLAANSWKYGFILRYPTDKVDKTGVSYQPWHFRFVGRFHANRMREMGLCLEEYIDYLKKSGYLRT